MPVGMGIAATFRAVGSNIVISLIRKICPTGENSGIHHRNRRVHDHCAAAFLHAYRRNIYKELGIYIPLIVVTHHIGQAEMFACKNSVGMSILDALGMGVGFTITLLIMGSISEILGSGTWMGLPLTKDLFDLAILMILPPGGFLAFCFIIAAMNKFSSLKIRNKEIASGCGMNCPGCANGNGGDAA